MSENKLIIQVDSAQLVLTAGSPVGTGEANAAANVGGGAGEVHRDTVAGVINLRTLVGLGTISVGVNGDTIEITAGTEQIVAPTVADDAFSVGTIWVDTALNAAYVMTDNTPAAAVWLPVGTQYTHPDHTGDVTSVGDGIQTIAPLAVTDAKVAVANKDGLAATPSMRTLGIGAQQATAGDDARLSDDRVPTGAADGGLGGTYPNPSVDGMTAGALTDDTAHGDRGGGTQHAEAVASGAAGFISGADQAKLDGIVAGANNYAHPNHTGDVTSIGDGAQTIVPLAVDDAKVATANKDGLPGVPSMRTLGAGAQQAAAGDDARLSDARTPTAHALGGAEHTDATLAELNAKVSDTDLIATSDPRLSDDRTPTVHGVGGAEHSASTLAQLNSKVSDATLDDEGDPRDADAIITTSGPTTLPVGAIADGEFLQRSGASVIGATPVGIGPHDLGGATHNADTLANLNSKVSDATLIDTGDPRLSDARTPTAHSHSHASTTGQSANDHHNQQHALGGADHTSATLAELNAKVSDATLIDTGDARLSDDRTPTAHDLSGSEHNPTLLAALNAKITDATLIDTGDARLSDARTPTSHAIAGAEHSASTLAQLNTKVSDATLDDAGDARTPTSHAIAGAEHSASTLAQLNTKVSDATLDDAGDARPPTAHSHTHSSTTGQTADDHHNQQHALGGADHTAATLAELNAKVSDATLIDTGDSRLSDARDADAIITTSGPTTLPVGAVADGEFLQRSGATIVGAVPVIPAHDLGGASHNADTLANLNSKVSDATLIDTGDPRLSDARPPTAHSHSHASTTGQGTDDHHNQQHALGGADHTSATLAQLNALVSDATLIDTGDSRLSDARTPTAHALGGAEHSADTLANLNTKVSDATLIDTGDSRLSDSRPPNGAAGGDLGGTYPNPTVNDAAKLPVAYQTVIALARTTTTVVNPLWATKLQLVTPALPAGTYRLGWTGHVDVPATNRDVRARCFNVTDAVNESGNLVHRPTQTTDVFEFGGFANIVFAGVAKTFELQWNTSNAATAAGFAQARLEIWRIA